MKDRAKVEDLLVTSDLPVRTSAVAWRHVEAEYVDVVEDRSRIGRHVWGEYRAHGAIEKLVARLRRKIDQERPALIHTRRGFGYWLGCPDG